MGIFSWLSSEIAYFPGCYSSAFARGKISNYEKILKKLGISFRTADENLCCGGILSELGYEKETRKISRDNFELFKAKGIKKIIASCPLCYFTLSKSYGEMLPDWSLKTEYILETILSELRKNKIFLEYSADDIVYYDSCCMSRYSKLHDAPREILKLFGFKVRDISIPSSEALCCGSCGALPETNRELADKIAGDFIKFLKRKGITKIVTADHRALKHLKENIYKLREQIEVVDISDIICDALGIRKNRENWE